MKIKLILLFAVSLMASCKCTKSSTSDKTASLEGTWQLDYISGPRIAFEGLYPNDKPSLVFDLKENKVSGKNSCNSYSGAVKLEGNTISFDQAGMITTKMFCDGEGEKIYMSTLNKINSYSVSNDGKTLNLLSGDISLMRFNKK